MGEAPRDHLTGQKLVCYFGLYLVITEGGTDSPPLIGVKGIIYVINLVWWVSYMVLNGIDLVIYGAGQ